MTARDDNERITRAGEYALRILDPEAEAAGLRIGAPTS